MKQNGNVVAQITTHKGGETKDKRPMEANCANVHQTNVETGSINTAKNGAGNIEPVAGRWPPDAAPSFLSFHFLLAFSLGIFYILHRCHVVSHLWRWSLGAIIPLFPPPSTPFHPLPTP